VQNPREQSGVPPLQQIGARARRETAVPNFHQHCEPLKTGGVEGAPFGDWEIEYGNEP
jgi:hypothetical protein